MDGDKGGRITAWLSRAPEWQFVLFAIAAAFATYFGMYAFRKPFAAGTYAGLTFFGTGIELKTAFVVSQLLGYTLSKFIGIRVCSESARRRRWAWLIGMIVVAEAALLLFAVLPVALKPLALFANGLPLGMVWGLCFSYLEGRRRSDLLLAGLNGSYILASGAVKDVGGWLMDRFTVGEFWMPALTGLLFLPGFILASWLLDQLPAPTAEDEEARTARKAMDRGDRWAFLRAFFPGLVMLIVGYVALTAFRDYRDNYGRELFNELGYGGAPAIFSQSELWVALAVMLTMGGLVFIRSNRRGLMAAFAVMCLGLVTLGLGTLARDAALISGLVWMILTGVGSYLAYVPFNSVLFDRLIAYTKVSATAVFTIYLADAFGYTGSVALQLTKDLGAAAASRLDFFRGLCYFMSIGGGALFLASAAYFVSWPARRGAEALEGDEP